MARKRPDEDAVRDTMRERDEQRVEPAPEEQREQPAGGERHDGGKPVRTPPTSRLDAGEPSGAEDAAAEAEMVEATEGASEQRAAGEERLAELRRERDEYLDLARRTRAELENYRKRAAKELAAAGERAKAGFVRELLPVVDNLERALAAAPEDDPMVEGVRLVHSDLVSTFQRAGVEAFDPAGEPFDPTFHEALSTRPADDAEAGRVVEVVEKGYRLNDAVLRPARVVVAG